MDITGWLVATAVSLAAGFLFIPRELWKRWRLRLVDRLDHGLRRGVSRFDRRYRDFVLTTLRFIDLKGLATVGFFTPELDEVFVDVSLAYRSPHEIPESLLARLPASITDRHSIGDFLDHEQPVLLAVIGAPGSGKTTLLRHTARLICRSPKGRRRTIPILLYLRDHVAAITADNAITLPELVRGTLGQHAPDEPPGWFEQRLRNGNCVVLLDGLDEVAKQADRQAVASWVVRQTEQYPRNDFVTTSRPQGYRTAPINGAVVLQVRSFTDEQITRFIRGWYLAAEKRSTGASAEEVRLRAESAADELLELLNAAPNLYDLTVNPLLLTMIANVHRYRGALPGSRSDLYGEICQVMLWRRQEAKRLPIELSGDKKEAMLRSLAFIMMRRRVRDLSRTDVLAELKPAIRRISTRLSEEDFLADVSSNGLLNERESGLYSFAHLTLQEYLAAAHIRDKGMVGVLADAVDDVWWRETTLLYAARSDADPIVRAGLDAGTVTALSLAFDCADQDSDLDPELRKRLDDLLNSTHDDPERQRLKAGILVTRHLRDLVPNGGRVCARPISNKIYGLYPHSTGDSTPEDDPVVGIRGSTAVAVANWINATIGEPRYRLPRRAEITDEAVQRALPDTATLSVWVNPEQPELVTPVGTDHPNAIDTDTLTRHVRADINRSASTLARIVLLDCAIDARVFARDLANTLDRLRQSRRDEDYVGYWSMRQLAECLDIAERLDASLDLDRARGLALHFGPDRYESARNLAHKLDHAHKLAYSIDRALNNASSLDHALALDRQIDSIFADSRDFYSSYLGNFTGIALTYASSGNMRDFAEMLASVSGIPGSGNWIVSLDELEGNICDCREEIVGSLGSWATTVAARIRELALPVVAGQQPLTADKVTAIRLRALCLAGETDAHRTATTRDVLHQIAAGITLLERRASGEAPVTETIVLAME